MCGGNVSAVVSSSVEKAVNAKTCQPHLGAYRLLRSHRTRLDAKRCLMEERPEQDQEAQRGVLA